MIVYCQPGGLPISTVKLTRGAEVFANLASSNANYIRNFGIFVTVQNGKLYLEEDYLAAQKNVPLTVAQSKILKMLGIKVGKYEGKILQGLINKKEILKIN